MVRNQPLLTVGEIARRLGHSVHRIEYIINRPFHVAIKRSGTKQIQSGAIVVATAGRVPRISRLLALAHHCFRLVQSGAIINQSELAHFGQISTARMTQIMCDNTLVADDANTESLL